MATILEFKRFMMAELPGNADLMVEYHMVEGVKDMCKKTFAYRETITANSVVDQAAYPLTIVTANAQLVSFLDGTYDTVEKCIIDIPELVLCSPQWRIAEGTPNYFVYEGGNTVRFDRIPQEVKALEFRVAIMPTAIISTMPVAIENDYIDALKDYVKWKVYGSDPINDMQTALLFKREYENGRDNLKRDVLRNYSDSYQVNIEGFG
jgi:hypothetical protein